MALPTSPFAVADSIYAGKSVVSLKIPAGGSAIVFETYKLENDYSIQEKSIKMPGTDGVLRKVRSQTTEEDDNWKFALPEAKRLLTIFTLSKAMPFWMARIYGCTPGTTDLPAR